jgi:hypothetical protein
MSPRSTVAQQPPETKEGWKWLYSRGYDVAAPAEYVFRCMVDSAPASTSNTVKASPTELKPAGPPVERRAHPERGVQKVTRWEIAPPDRITFHDEVFRRGRLVIQGEERYRLLGEGGPGCIVEVTALRRPVGWLSRVGFALFPEWSVRTRRQEAALFKEIEDDFRAGRRAKAREGLPGGK